MREDWIELEIGNLFKVVSGSTPKGINNIISNSGVPFFKVGDMNSEGNEHFLKRAKIYIDDKANVGLKTKIYPKGTVVFPKRGGAILTNKKRVLNQDSSFDLNVMGVLPNSAVVNEFTFFWFEHLDLAKICDGSNVPQINNKNILPLQFPLAPLPEQRAIVAKIEELFSSLDNGIANLEKAQKQLKVYRQAVLKKAFEGELTKEWREKQTDLPSAEELLEQIKTEREKYYEQQLADWKVKVAEWEEKGKEGKKPGKPKKLTVPEIPTEKHERRKWILPKEWIWTQVGDLCFITKLAGFEYTDYVNYTDDGNLFVIKAENAGPLGYRHKVYSKVRYNEVKSLERSIVKGGELLVVFVGAGTGNVATVQFDKQYFLGPNIGMGRPYFTMSTRFIELFLQSSIGKNVMMSTVKAVAQPSLSMGSIRQSPIIFASHKEQLQIVQEIEYRLSVCDKVEESIVVGLKKSEALKQSILKKAFEGALLSEVELEACRKEKDWEPAEVLLERIKKEKK